MAKKFSAGVVLVTVLLLIPLAISPSIASASAYPDKYIARTADGVDLAMKRYRPDQKARFRTAGQPVILMPGIISNFNTFDICTPSGMSYDVQLPSPLAGWARNDPYIKKDPMKYYSLAHYLWNQGFDVWLANYRGEGRDPYMSGGASGYSVDDCGIYDLPAIVEKVYGVTGKHPVYMGHSMGSSMAYIYLEGARYGEGDNPHVISDPVLVAERNGGNGKQSLKAFVDLDGPMGTAGGVSINDASFWDVFSAPWYVDIRTYTDWLGDLIGGPTLALESLTWFIYQLLGFPDLGFYNASLMVNPNNIDPNVMRYLTKYAVDGVSTRTFAQLLDAHCHSRYREDFLNGCDPSLTAPPDPCPGDGYYYYSDNLAKIKLPALIMADSTNDLTLPQDIKNFYNNKARNPRDVFLIVPGTAHVDLVCGLNCPTVTFPQISEWLKKLPR
jgi:pimeloyl-ACP methyl ester carboxylesterase